MRIVTLFFTSLLFLSTCAGNNTNSKDFEPYRQRIIQNLNNIDSYEMTVLYSEATTDNKSSFADFSKLLLDTAEKYGDFKDAGLPTSDGLKDSLAVKSITKMAVKYKKPNYLYMDANGNMAQGNVDGNTLIMNIYTTFDGTKQKARSSVSMGEKTQTSSIVLDTSSNDPARPFDGWNLKGFGFSPGTEYISTVKELLDSYDFVYSDTEGKIIIFSGTLNTDKLIKGISKNLPEEAAQMFASMAAKTQKSFYIKVDPEKDLIVGFFGENEAAFNTVKRICTFENIKINQKISPDDFIFQALPDEEFTDITDMILASREQQANMFKGLQEK